MTLWILDTDTLSLLQRGNASVVSRISITPPEQIAIVTFEEQIYGRLNRIRRANTEESLVLAYRQLRETIEDFKTIRIVDFTEDAARYYRNCLDRKIRVGTQDLRIAAIALSNNATLVTRNNQDFSCVPNLKLEDWTIENQSRF